MIKAGIIGGAGYTAGELIRLLTFHPQVSLDYIQSNSQKGKLVSEIHADLLDEIQIKFSAEFHWDVDVVFICVGHGKSRELLEKVDLSKIKAKIIDLSTDFRMDNDWTYGLTEWNKEKISTTKALANPGCFATAIQLGILPLLHAGKIQSDIHVNAITGSTGAGVMPAPTTHFSWRHSNVSIYKPFQHQHTNEIYRTMQSSGCHQKLNFIPVRGNFSRGIFASIYTSFVGSQEEAEALFNQYYSSSPFVTISTRNPDLKQVINTNKALLHVQVIDGKILIVSLIDNLLKGASGQAVQNMNLMFGIEEYTGLKLKSIGF